MIIAKTKSGPAPKAVALTMIALRTSAVFSLERSSLNKSLSRVKKYKEENKLNKATTGTTRATIGVVAMRVTAKNPSVAKEAFAISKKVLNTLKLRQFNVILLCYPTYFCDSDINNGS